MNTLLGSFLAAVLVAQAQGGALQGKVVDDQGKPVTDAQVVLFTPEPWIGVGEPVELQTRTGAQGGFRFSPSRLHRAADSRLWAYRPGLAVAAISGSSPPFELVLHKAQTRTVKVEGPDGRPVAGARLSPLILSGPGRSSRDELPESLAAQLAVKTGADGQATLNDLVGGDKLVTVRLKAPSIGTQDLQLLVDPPPNNQGATITIQLSATQRLAGRVRNRAGQAVAGQEVEVWSRGDFFRRMNPVVFQGGPVRTAADGSFRTPENLLVGSTYMVVVRAPAFEPIFSRWITIGPQPPLSLPLLQRPLRTIRGRVVDRQGKALSEVEVFQSGDGPERTTTRTHADGRFKLEGFREGPVFLLARREGFRYFGRLIKPGEEEVVVRMIKIGERPAPELHTLPEPIRREEAQALTRRLVQPCWDAAVAQKDREAASRTLVILADGDPLLVLRRLETEDVASRVEPIQFFAILALARSDPARAEELAESIDPLISRGLAFWTVADALPSAARDHKLALLARAAAQAKATEAPVTVARIARSLNGLGEKEKARALVAAYLGDGKVDPRLRLDRGLWLARLDATAALGIARELAANNRQEVNQILWNVALGLAEDNPAEAERVLRLVPQGKGRSWMHPVLAWKMALSDPARARRLADESQRYHDSPQTYLYLACGLKGRDPAAAEAAFWEGIKGIDRLLDEGAQRFAMKIRGGPAALMPLVEQIDPTLVSEVFWRALAARAPLANPRALSDGSLSELVQFLAWYDREVAAALFESDRVLREQSADPVLARRVPDFLSWLLWNPPAAVEWLERLRATSDEDAKAILKLREDVGIRLGHSYEDRWRLTWYRYGYGQMKTPLDREVW
jgi:hypothetical protein